MSGSVRSAPRETRRAARDRVRSSLVVAANELFQSCGFEASTTADIAARAGVSQRTFFRYFACKEDVVVHWLDSYNDRICQRLRERPRDESLVRALRRALDVYCDLDEAETERVEILKGCGLAVETTFLQASRIKGVGPLHRLAAETPVFVVAGRRGEI